jgi:NAD(P)-dependent dehydrogenase (short-subunit alcohol dehydrogenase family)
MEFCWISPSHPAAKVGKVMHNTKQICLITGATAGIGKAAATALAAQGLQMILTGRNPAKLENVVNQVRAQTGNQSVHFLVADFSDLQQVRQLANQFNKQFPHLDILINNAGAYFNRRHRTIYGVEKTFLVNHLAPFLLTNLLLDHLQNSPSARIINVSSNAHLSGQLDLEDLNFYRFYFGFWAYGRSKLANILFAYELARRLKNGHVKVNALHPGRVGTDIFKTDFSIFGYLLKWFVERISLTPEEGADNTVYLATSPEMKAVTGKYFVKRAAVSSSPLSYDEDLARRLWEVSEKITL